MIQFFRKSYAVQYVIFCVLALALWAPALIIGHADVALRSPVAPLFNLVADVLSFSSYAMVAFAFLLLIAEALIFNHGEKSNYAEKQHNSSCGVFGADEPDMDTGHVFSILDGLFFLAVDVR